MKHIPNLISICRIVILFSLFFAYRYPVLFLVLYLITGLTDVLDGYLARKWKVQSDLGAKLDSFADLIMYLCITISILLILSKEVIQFIPGVILIIVVRVINLLLVAIKFHTFAIIHTIANKATGLGVFLLPLFALAKWFPAIWILIGIGVFSAVEENIILMKAKKLNLNQKSFFIK